MNKQEKFDPLKSCAVKEIIATNNKAKSELSVRKNFLCFIGDRTEKVSPQIIAGSI